MKFFKSTLVIVALFAIGSVSARVSSSRTGAKPATPTKPSIPITPTPAPEESKGIYVEIMNQIADATKSIGDANTSAVNNIKDKISQAAYLPNNLKLELIELARNMQDALSRNTEMNTESLDDLTVRLFPKPLPKLPPKK